MDFYYKEQYCSLRPIVKLIVTMKLILLVIILGVLQVNAESYGQTVTLTKKNAPLTVIFQEIRKQTNYDFVYSDRMMEIAEPVTVDIKNLDLEEALARVFSSQPLTYVVDREMIIVRMKASARPTLPAKPVGIQPQETVVRGKVTNNAGEPVGGVTVMIGNTTTGTKTDDSGNYSLQVPSGNAVLHFSSLGYAPQE